MTQHLSAVSERAETVSGRNYELQREMSDAQAENTKLRKDCQSLIQVSAGAAYRIAQEEHHAPRQSQTLEQFDDSLTDISSD